MNILEPSFPSKQHDSQSTEHLANLLVAAKGLSERLGEIGVIDSEQLRFTVMAREDRKPVVLALHKQGLSTRKIAEIVGVNNATIHRDIQGTVANATKGVANATPGDLNEAEASEANGTNVPAENEVTVSGECAILKAAAEIRAEKAAIRRAKNVEVV